MTVAYEVPLTPSPQQLAVALGGVVYTLTLKWSSPAAAWILDIADALGAPILRGVPLVTGADLLAQYAYLDFGGQLVAQTDHALDVVPTFENLGSIGHLYFLIP